MLRPSADFHEVEIPSLLHIFSSIKQRLCFRQQTFQEGVLRRIKPLTTSLAFGTVADLTRGKAELMAENALLRHQLIILLRQVKRPVYRKTTGFSWCCWPGWFGPGNRLSFSCRQMVSTSTRLDPIKGLGSGSRTRRYFLLFSFYGQGENVLFLSGCPSIHLHIHA